MPVYVGTLGTGEHRGQGCAWHKSQPLLPVPKNTLLGLYGPVDSIILLTCYADATVHLQLLARGPRAPRPFETPGMYVYFGWSLRHA